MVTIRDMLYVKQLERRLGRPLTEEEMSGDDTVVELPNGDIEVITVPLLPFPDALLSAPECFNSEAQFEGED